MKTIVGGRGGGTERPTRLVGNFLLLATTFYLTALPMPVRAEVSWSIPAPLNSNADTDTGFDDLSHFATDGAGTWVAVWQSTETLGGAIGSDLDILFARSMDNGLTWSSPAPLNTNAAGDAGDDTDARVATDGSGVWLVIWTSGDNLGGTIGTDSDILFARSADNGANWSAPAPLNTNAATDVALGGDQHPHLTTDRAGNWVVAWDSTENVGGAIGNDFDILYARSSDNGASWTAPAALNSTATTDSAGDERPEIITDGAGNWLAAWRSSSGTFGSDFDILCATSTDKGASWSGAFPLNDDALGDSKDDTEIHLATDGAGTWVAVWRLFLGGTGIDTDLLYARSQNNGVIWSSPIILNSNALSDTGNDEHPRVATDGRRNWVVVWDSNDTLGGTIGGDKDIFFVRSTDNATTFSDPTLLNINEPDIAGLDSFPEVANDGASTWLAVWPTLENLGGVIGFDSDIAVARTEFTGTLQGRITDADTGLPVDCATLQAIAFADINYRKEGSGSNTWFRLETLAAADAVYHAAVTDLNGQYRFDGLPEGDYRLEVYGVEHEGAVLQTAVAGGAMTVEDIALAPRILAGGIRGGVRDVDTLTALVGVRIDAKINETLVATTFSCGTGRYSLNGLVTKGSKATTVDLDFTAPGYSTTQTAVPLEPGQNGESNARMEKAGIFPGILTGVVSDAIDATTIESARISISGPGAFVSITDANGVYTFPALPEGRFTVHSSALGYLSQTLSQAVQNGFQTTVLNVALTPESNNPFDIDGADGVNAVDVQLVINAALGIDIGGLNANVDGQNGVNAVDVQLVINGALGIVKSF
ncbi:MAG: carboxypeptidase regulatory-like domain-containing protein [Candidatus Hydrogenedentes bacterium]|nr:carboxypeptidase regulatory-like domain-containing protein [Candidatus Hydrogenedentota bacterium]